MGEPQAPDLGRLHNRVLHAVAVLHHVCEVQEEWTDKALPAVRNELADVQSNVRRLEAKVDELINAVAALAARKTSTCSIATAKRRKQRRHAKERATKLARSSVKPVQG